MSYVNTLASKIEARYITKKFDFNIGDTIDVAVKVVEGDKTRLQSFVGTVLAMRNRGVSSSFIVRKISYGIAVERTFPLHSPLVDTIKVIKRGKVRKAKLYSLRGKFGKSARIEEKIG